MNEARIRISKLLGNKNSNTSKSNTSASEYFVLSLSASAVDVIGQKKITLLIKDSYLVVGIPDIDTKKIRTISVCRGHGSISIGGSWNDSIVGEYEFDEREGDNTYFNKL